MRLFRTKAFLCFKIRLNFLLTQGNWRKCANKMLVKLTTGGAEILTSKVLRSKVLRSKVFKIESSKVEMGSVDVKVDKKWLIL